MSTQKGIVTIHFSYFYTMYNICPKIWEVLVDKVGFYSQKKWKVLYFNWEKSGLEYTASV